VLVNYQPMAVIPVAGALFHCMIALSDEHRVDDSSFPTSANSSRVVARRLSLQVFPAELPNCCPENGDV
jgi:hypothetical protein